MSRQQALEQAQRLWGSSGAVYCFHETFYEVGIRTRFDFIVAYGIDLVTLAAMLGHSKINMVLRYAHPTARHQA